MASFSGTSANETITPDVVSSTVTSTPAGSRPGASADIIQGYDGADTLSGGGGDDTIYGDHQFSDDDGDASDIIYGDAGNDTIYISTGGDQVFGGSQDDLLVVKIATGRGSLNGDAGTDTLQLYGVDITGASLSGIERTELLGTSDARMTTGQLDDLGTIAGLNGATSADIDLTGGGTASGIRSSLAQLDLFGSEAADTIRFLAAVRTKIAFEGGGGRDVVVAGRGADTLNGDDGSDQLNGGDGNDIVNGGDGKDTLKGGAGKDSFVFDSDLKTANADRIVLFVARDDTLRLESREFGSLKEGRLSASVFKDITKGPVDQGDRILYDGDTGALYFDNDGSGGSARVLVATLVGDPTLSPADFLIV